VTYNRTLEGPKPDQSFLVRAGVVVVVGIEETVLLPAGVVWPGSGALPEELMAWLAPAQTFLGEKDGAVPWEASPREVEFTTALVQVHRLRSKAPLAERLEQLGELIDVGVHSQYALAAMLGARRESLTHGLSTYRARNRNAAD
jgi:hypothetical protein